MAALSVVYDVNDCHDEGAEQITNGRCIKHINAGDRGEQARIGKTHQKRACIQGDNQLRCISLHPGQLSPRVENEAG